jgi:hypothetical protein
MGRIQFWLDAVFLCGFPLGGCEFPLGAGEFPLNPFEFPLKLYQFPLGFCPFAFRGSGKQHFRVWSEKQLGS